MVKRIKLVLIDIDDCLMPTNGEFDEDYFSGLPKVAQYIKTANQGKFPQIGFCTGRDRNYVEATARSVCLPNSWSVIENGIALFNPTTKEILFNPDFTPDTQRIFDTIRKKRLPSILEKFPFLFEHPGNIVSIALEVKHGEETSIKECYEIVKKELADLKSQGFITISHSSIAVDITPQKIDKSSGVKFLAQKTGISLEEIGGIGDSRGDFSMLNLVGFAACPDNASTECKELVSKKGGYISPFRYARGISDICHFIEEF